MKKIKRITGPLFFMIGCTILYVMLKKFGFSQILTTIVELRYWVLFVCAFPLTWYVAQTLGWYFVMSETAQHVSFWQLLKIKLSGEAVNTMTPISFMGGDPVRIYLLKKRMPTTLSTASTVLDRTMQSLAVILFLLSGLGLAWLTIDLPPLWKKLFPIVVVTMLGLVWFFIHHQRKGIFEFLSRLLTRLGFKRHQSERIQDRIAELDERIARFYGQHPWRFILVLLMHFLARVLGAFEIYFIAQFLNIDMGLLGGFYLASLSILVNFVFVFIPGSMGIMEGAYGALCHLMGLAGYVGVAIQLVRRLRALFWIFVGLLLMLLYNKIHARELALQTSS